jgi:hypothetical protein
MDDEEEDDVNKCRNQHWQRHKRNKNSNINELWFD